MLIKACWTISLLFLDMFAFIFQYGVEMHSRVGRKIPCSKNGMCSDPLIEAFTLNYAP